MQLSVPVIAAEIIVLVDYHALTIFHYQDGIQHRTNALGVNTQTQLLRDAGVQQKHDIVGCRHPSGHRDWKR